MGIVIPCDRIIEILQRPDLVAERRQAMKNDITTRSPVPTGIDAPAPKEAVDENPTHRDSCRRGRETETKR
jgi:hypothetical protein